jgi:glycosyltransferase involved in cell wall biosynthesis
VVDGAAAIRAEGFVLHPVPFVRGRIAPFGTVATIRTLRDIHRNIAPDIVYHVALQTTILGSIAALRPVSTVNALTGLGYTFTSGNAKAMLLRPILSALLRLLLNRPKQLVLVQNPDDRDSMRSLGIAPGRIATIPGSGVDVHMLQPHPEPPGAPAIAFVGRLLADKGIRTLIGAHRLLRERGSNIELLIAGTPDPANPASVSAQEAAGWSGEPGITWLGHVEDISALWARAHIGSFAIAARGTAEEPARGCGLWPANGCHRRAGMPRNRYPRRHRPAGPVRRSAVTGTRDRNLGDVASLAGPSRSSGTPAGRRALLGRGDRPADR